MADIINPDIKKIFECLDNKARFVGGCVRNILLGVDITDIDIACQYQPDVTIEKLEKAGIKVIPTGIKHGTVTAVLNDVPYEITTLRRDVACDGRHAEVEFTDSWEEDAARRDFTINAMYMDIESKIYDYFDGQKDLKEGVVRFVGNAENRVSEDILRILRFFRFYAYYGKGGMDANALDACEKYADKIPTLSAERIQTEMSKLLAAKEPGVVLKVMQDKGINKYLFVSDINLNALENIKDDIDNVQLRLACLINGFSKEEVKEQAGNWKLSKKDTNYLLSVLYPDVKIDLKGHIRQQQSAIRSLGRIIYADIVLLAWACEDISPEELENLLELADKWFIPIFPVKGSDLQKLGFKEGKQIGDVLSKAEDWWEENDYEPDKKEILDHIVDSNKS